MGRSERLEVCGFDPLLLVLKWRGKSRKELQAKKCGSYWGDENDP